MKLALRTSSHITALGFLLLVGAAAGSALVTPAWPAEQLVIKPLTEKKLTDLPEGPLFWRIENFPTLEQAKAAAGATALAAEAAGKAWLFTLGPSGGSSAGGSRVAEIGPVPPIAAKEVLLRINRASGPPKAQTAAHSHPGSEAFYVLTGRMGQKTPHGIAYANAGEAMNGHQGDTPMIVFNAGDGELDQLVMFVVDASRPFSSPATLPGIE